MSTDDWDRAQRAVDRWNVAHSVGAEVRVRGYTQSKRTRTPAMLLFGRKAVLYLEGHHGYFDLDQVSGESASDATLCFMFPGQGSQATGMGAGLFEAYPDHVASADRVLGYSIADLCLRDPKGVLVQTQFTQPALYVVSCLSHLRAIDELGERPGFLLGHSVGEYGALFAAGSFDFETGLRLVRERGERMAEAVGGAMAAVIGMNAEEVSRVLERHGLDTLDLANLNAPDQTVISGRAEDVERAQATFEAEGARAYVRLRVSGAFHSRYMQPAAEAFGKFLERIELSAPSAPVISNVTARPYEADRVRALLMEQLTSPVRWMDSIGYLEQVGVRSFREIGPGKVLQQLLQRVRRSS